ncbi:hypothetical protein R6Q59_006053 [Mikania micrantha]
MELHKTCNDCNDDDALSLRDLQMYDQTANSSTRSSPRTSSAQESFEFFSIPSSNSTATTDVISVNTDYRRLIVGSSSFRFAQRPIEHAIPLRSVSNRGVGSHQLSTSVKKVSMTTTSSKSKRRMFSLGPVKFMPEMEMRSIRERQGRLAQSRTFPVAVGGDARKAVDGGGAHRNTVSCRDRLNSVFGKSVACLRSEMENPVAIQLPEADSLPDGFIDSSAEPVTRLYQETQVTDYKEDKQIEVDSKPNFDSECLSVV